MLLDKTPQLYKHTAHINMPFFAIKQPTNWLVI